MRNKDNSSPPPATLSLKIGNWLEAKASGWAVVVLAAVLAGVGLAALTLGH